MSWRLLQTHAWEAPLDFAGRFAAEKELALLYSGRAEQSSGHTSYLFLEPAYQYTGSRWADLPPLTEENTLPQLVGYLGYGMRCDLENYQRNAPSPIPLPDFWLIRYERLFRFDHGARTIEEYGTRNRSVPDPVQAVNPGKIAEIRSNMTRAEYGSIVEKTLENIRAGNFYQANITRKFFGEFTDSPDTFTVFRALSEASPAPFSAYIKHGDTAILSSSPECFLSITSDTVTTRPIKGSSRRGTTAEEDATLQQALLASAKNQAENRMIVDLMRNDLSRVSEPGSIQVTEQNALHSYPTIHHLISSVQAKKQPEKTMYDVVKACFPPGSMTGAPKIAAVHWCDAQEQMERGVYSGAIGWFGSNACDLSVVIRTLVIQDNRFEFQVGGGIVADSTADEEWQETLIKARGIAKALDISEAQLEAL